MPYINKQKFQIHDLADIAQRPKRIVIYEPEEYLAALYAHYLRQHSFDVKHCPDLGLLKQLMLSFSPQMLVYNIEQTQSPKAQLNRLLKLKTDFPDTFVITTGFNTGSEILKLLLEAGIASHINRRLSRPQDLPMIVKSILYQNN
ncbi:MAG: hypothetical protein ACHQVK_00815 [Candidatus Paceibacterales bacterium]